MPFDGINKMVINIIREATKNHFIARIRQPTFEETEKHFSLSPAVLLEIFANIIDGSTVCLLFVPALVAFGSFIKYYYYCLSHSVLHRSRCKSSFIVDKCVKCNAVRHGYLLPHGLPHRPSGGSIVRSLALARPYLGIVSPLLCPSSIPPYFILLFSYYCCACVFLLHRPWCSHAQGIPVPNSPC